jgi:hypothetical protein
MKRFLKSKKGIAILATLAVIAGAGAAYASFSSSGAGTGTATVGASHNVVISSTTTGTLYPVSTAPAANTTITIDNTAGGGNEYVNQVTLTSITNSNEYNAGSNPGGCKDIWFEFDTSPVTIAHTVNAGSTYTTPTAVATIWLKDDGVTPADQDGCQNVTVTAHYTSN